jgi:hypothetical protein
MCAMIGFGLVLRMYSLEAIHILAWGESLTPNAVVGRVRR